MKQLIDAYVYRRAEGGVQFLLLHRSPGKIYAGSWRMVGGKVEPGETHAQAALREVREETGREPVAFWCVPSCNIFHEWHTDQTHIIPAFAAELAEDPDLNPEHDAFMWCGMEDAVRLLDWPEQQRLVRLVADLLQRPRPDAWEIPLGELPPTRGVAR